MGVNWRKDAALSTAREMAQSGDYPNAGSIRHALKGEEGLDVSALDPPLVWNDLNQLCALHYKGEPSP